MQNCRTHLNNWAQRDLSIVGRIFLTKMESICRLIYPAYTLGVPKSAILYRSKKPTMLGKVIESNNVKMEDGKLLNLTV